MAKSYRKRSREKDVYPTEADITYNCNLLKDRIISRNAREYIIGKLRNCANADLNQSKKSEKLKRKRTHGIEKKGPTKKIRKKKNKSDRRLNSKIKRVYFKDSITPKGKPRNEKAKMTYAKASRLLHEHFDEMEMKGQTDITTAVDLFRNSGATKTNGERGTIRGLQLTLNVMFDRAIRNHM